MDHYPDLQPHHLIGVLAFILIAANHKEIISRFRNAFEHLSQIIHL